MNLTELSKQIRFDNASKGFDPTEGGLDRYLLLTISELCEAQDELRNGRDINEVYYTDNEGNELLDTPLTREYGKPCGFPVEIADAIIRLLDICGKFNISVRILKEYYNVKSKDEIETILLVFCKDIALLSYDNLDSSLGANRFNVNIASIIGRLIAFCNSPEIKIDILKVINEKLAFNKSRPPKHGRKF